MEQHRKSIEKRSYLAYLLLTACVVMLSACHSKPPTNPTVKRSSFELKSSGVDYTQVLGCIGSIKADIQDTTYDRQRRVTGYTSIVTCVNSLKSYKLTYSKITYSGRRRTSYREEMICNEPKEHRVVLYTNIKYNEAGEVIGYTTNLNGKTYKE